MLRIDVVTLFPAWFGWLLEERHVQNVVGDRVSLAFHDLRDYSISRHRLVDDTPYGGGAGMVLRVDVTVDAVEAVGGGVLDDVRRSHRVIALDPGGRQLDDTLVRELSAGPPLIVLCGRYEGFDHRVLEHVATDIVSIGPYVLSGGEVAAMVLIDALCRHLPDALGHEQSAEEESFSPALGGDLEYPQYTRPACYRGWSVPAILTSGDHGRIAGWRRDQARLRTRAAGESAALGYDPPGERGDR